MSMGPAPFYDLQALHEAQGAPSDPTGDAVQFDQGAAAPMPQQPTGPFQPTGTAFAQQFAQPPAAPPPMMAQPPPQPGMAPSPPMTPMGPQGPVVTPPPSGDLTANVPDLQARMQQYIDMSKRMYDPLKRQENAWQPSQPSMVARLLTFGLAGLPEYNGAQEAYRRNAVTQQHNAALDVQAMNAARQMMAADATMQMAQARFGMEQMRFSLEALRAQSAETDRRVNDEMRLMQMRAFPYEHQMGPSGGGTPPPPPTSAPGMPAAGDFAPPAPGSPLAETGGAPASPAGPSATPTMQPGELPFDFAQRRKGEIAAQAAKEKEAVTTTASTRTMKEAVPKVLDLVNKVEQNLNAVDAGPLASRVHEFKAGTLGMSDPNWIAYRTNTGLLQTLLMRMHVGARGSEGMIAKFRDLIDQGRQSPENMRAALAEIRDYANSVAGNTTVDTTTAAPPPATPLAPIPALGVEDILKKHGY